MPLRPDAQMPRSLKPWKRVSVTENSASSAEQARRRELAAQAPIRPRSVACRGSLDGKDVCFLCGTIGSEFDQWQRRLAVTSAADALFSQQLGLEAVEKVMDELEAALRKEIESEGRRLLPRWSPGYGDRPLSMSREILERLDAPRKIGVSLTESNLLVPSKSVTAVCEIEG